MGINNIGLSTALLVMLYPDSLVVENDLKTGSSVPASSKPVAVNEPAVAANEPCRYLGKNLKQICFAVSYPGAVFLPDNQLEFLTRIIGACQLSLADIALVNLAHTTAGLNDLISQINPRILFLCGLPASRLNRPEAAAFTPQTTNGLTMINIPSLEEINQETPSGIALKKQLWAILKKLFNL